MVNANLTFGNEDSGINIWEGSHDAIVTNNVSYGNGDHGVDNKASNNTRILSNTIYLSTNSGIEVVNSTGVDLANNISVDNGLGPQSSDGNFFVDTLSAPTITLNYDLVFLGGPGVMVEFNGVEYGVPRRVHLGHRPGGQRPAGGSRSSRTSRRTTSPSPPVHRPSTRRTPGWPTIRRSTRTASRAKDDANTANTGVGPRTFDDRGAYEFSSK